MIDFVIGFYLLANFSVLSFIFIVLQIGLFAYFLHEVAAYDWHHRENEYFRLYLELGQKNSENQLDCPAEQEYDGSTL